MTIYKGKDLIIKIGNGSSPSEIFTEIEGVMSSSVKYQNQFFDNSNVVSNDWQQINASLATKSIIVNMDGIYHSSNPANLLRAAAFSGSDTNFEIIFGSGDKIAGSFIVSEYERTAKEKSEEYFKVSLQSSGNIEYFIN